MRGSNFLADGAMRRRQDIVSRFTFPALRPRDRASADGQTIHGKHAVRYSGEPDGEEHSGNWEIHISELVRQERSCWLVLRRTTGEEPISEIKVERVWRAGSVSDRRKLPPVAHAPGSPSQSQSKGCGNGRSRSPRSFRSPRSPRSRPRSPRSRSRPRSRSPRLGVRPADNRGSGAGGSRRTSLPL